MGTTWTDPLDRWRNKPANVNHFRPRLPNSTGMLCLDENRRRAAITRSRNRPDARTRRLHMSLRRKSERLRQKEDELRQRPAPVLRPVLLPPEPDQPALPDVPVMEIARLCAEAAGISLRDILSARRGHTIDRARLVCMYLAKKLTKRSLPAIGKRLGGKHHSTVLHAVRRIEELARAGDEDVLALLAFARRHLPVWFEP